MPLIVTQLEKIENFNDNPYLNHLSLTKPKITLSDVPKRFKHI